MLHRPAARTTTRALALAVALVALPATGALAGPAPAAAPTPSGPCPDDDGVTVVVDLTDLGGEVEVGCAPGAPETGTAALLAAGFTEERAESGFICAISDHPDPCPTEFDGRFWSYWNAAEPGADWVSYEVGSDESTPAPGSVEGWRYSDGSEGPTVPAPGPDDAADAGSGAAGDDASDDADRPTSTTVDEETGAATDPAIAPLAIAGGAVALLALVAVLATRRRRDPNGPAGQS